ncbi:ferritin family protein [Rossellomorea marisflavi]|uniref:ferritin family protein n=1 Tax=Rossellomorea marisflavi TaxID=189381 RepID=UPI003D2F47FD
MHWHHLFSHHRHYERSIRDTQLIHDIQTAIHAEYSALTCYEKLAKLAPVKEERDKILEIQKDEKRHFKEFTRIYTNLTGRQPMFMISGECPDEYRSALEYSFVDEQEGVDFYLNIADKAEDAVIKDRFRRAAADEQNHAVWFLYLIQQLKMPDRQLEQYGAQGALADSTLTLPKMLTYALQDEYLAQARYDQIVKVFGPIRPFIQIKEAEKNHIHALLPLFERYQIPIPADTSQSLVSTPASIKAAYAAGVEGEIDNISMYERFLSQDLPSDAKAVFSQLRRASMNHLAAFEKGLEKME